MPFTKFHVPIVGIVALICLITLQQPLEKTKNPYADAAKGRNPIRPHRAVFGKHTHSKIKGTTFQICMWTCSFISTQAWAPYYHPHLIGCISQLLGHAVQSRRLGVLPCSILRVLVLRRNGARRLGLPIPQNARHRDGNCSCRAGDGSDNFASQL